MASIVYRIFKVVFFCSPGLFLFPGLNSLYADSGLSYAEITHQEEKDSTVSFAVELQTRILDSAYLDKNIFSLLSGRSYENGSVVNLISSPHIEGKLEYYRQNAVNRPIRGFRIRIFFDNRQDARTRSEKIEASFSEKYPALGVYRSYENPYFKVTVGDLRTRSEAEKLLRKLEKEYPSSFIVREEISFPPLGF
jgi:hypothetical protein